MSVPEESPPRTPAPRRAMLPRIERAAGVPALAATLAERLSPGDLQSLMLEVYALRARARRPRELLSEYRRNRFVRPCALPVERTRSWEALAWSMLPRDFEAIELAPVAPLGAVSVLAPLSQDWSVSTARNTEVVSDATNVLALEAAARREELLKVDPTNQARVHLAASHRLLRGQRFAEGPGVQQHFRLFALCSAGRDRSGLRFESEVAREHVTYFVRALQRYLGRSVRLRVALSDLRDRPTRGTLESGLAESLGRSLKGVPVEHESATPEGRSYYRELRFHVYAEHPRSGACQLVDGGGVDWSRKLLNNAKERMFISGIGSERLTQLFEPASDLRSGPP
jgi:hypothetical protein